MRDGHIVSSPRHGTQEFTKIFKYFYIPLGSLSITPQVYHHLGHISLISFFNPFLIQASSTLLLYNNKCMLNQTKIIFTCHSSCGQLLLTLFHAHFYSLLYQVISLLGVSYTAHAYFFLSNWRSILWRFVGLDFYSCF